MKIAIVTNTCWNVYNFREGLVRHLLESGHEVISLAPRDNYTAKIEKWGVRFIETPLDQTGANPIKDFNYLMSIRKIFKDIKPDVALCFTIKSNIYSSIAGKLTRVPTICNVSGLGTVFLVSGWTGKIAMMLYRFAFRHSNRIFFQNEEDQELFNNHVPLEKGKQGILPGSGINLQHFGFKEHQISNSTKFIMISRVIEEKGVRDFVEASRILKSENRDVHFTLVGDLDESHSRSIPKSELDKWVRSGYIEYLPHSNKVQELIGQSEVVVLPSYREGTPRTLLEGAAIGRPLLTSDVPGCREVVRDGYNGFLFEVKSGKNLSDKAKLYMALSPEEKRSMALNSRKLVEEKFDESIVINHYVEAIGQIVDK